MQRGKGIIFLLVLFFSACRSENNLNLNHKGDNYSTVSVLVYDGEKSFNINKSENGTFILKKTLLSTTINSQYLLVVYKKGFLPSYKFKTYTGEDFILDIPKLEKFSDEKSMMAYISGLSTRASMGGKINFHSGLTVLDSKYRIHVFELDEKNVSKRDFYIESDTNGYFGAYVNPGKYRIQYGKSEEFQLTSSENGIFLTSMKTIID